MQALRGLRVVDFSTGIAGPYCTKLLADAGADVIKFEQPRGDPLRRWSASGAELGADDGALFRFLHHGKRAVVGDPAAAEVLDLVAGADLVVESFAGTAIDAGHWLARFPSLVLLSISPFGRSGPWAARPASEFTLQAESGSIGTRGLPGEEPFAAGGRIGEWVAGSFAAVGALAAVQRAQRSGQGEHVDLSVLEALVIAASNYAELTYRLVGLPATRVGLPQSVETPSIEPTLDGFVGFCTNSAQQFSDFLLLIERPDLRADRELAQVGGRMARFHEWTELVRSWTRKHPTHEIVERASALRIPVAPVLDGESVRTHEQIVARGALVADPSGTFLQPRVPYRIDGAEPEPFRGAPRLGEHTGRIEARARPLARGEGPALPLEGMRIVDFTAWWAGPSATWILACLGADVIHVEAPQRIDGMRTVGGMLMGRVERWWECSSFFLAANANKRGLAVDLGDARGLARFERLLAISDALVENFTPRVLDGFGLTRERLREINPRLVCVRMPAFGLDGPWRDHTGFAQTMEQLTGLAWITGHPHDQPRIQRGPCDPLAGMHAAYALLTALHERERTGRGSYVESTMVEAALNAAAEQVVEFGAYGHRMQREGNRAPHAAPQGLYPCSGSERGREQWLALSVETDAQWEALVDVLGRPAWAESRALATLRGRRAAHDAIDAELLPWFASREREKLVEELVRAGVPAAAVADPRALSTNPQLTARSFFETSAHSVAGEHPLPGLPFRYASVPRWIRTPAPTLGQHNRDVLGGLLGLSDGEIAALEADGVIGELPRAR